MKESFYEKLNCNPVIAAVKNAEQLDIAIESPCEVIFLLSGNIFNIPEIVQKVKQNNMQIFIHVDLIDGFSRDSIALEYINEKIKPTGIISTKSSMIKIAKELGLLTVQRLFIIDSLSLQNIVKTTGTLKPDALEIMPGVMPKIISKICNEIDTPLIAGGLINEKEDVIHALNAGARGVSTTNPKIWTI